MVRSVFYALGLCFLAGILVGCAGKGGSQSLPDWVVLPPDDTAEAIYGVGEGRSLREARDDALADIAGKLETRVSADVEMETVLANGEERSRTRNRIRTTTEALRLTEFRTHKSAESATGLFVLVSIDRASLISSMEAELATLDSEITGRLSDSEGDSVKRMFRLTMSLPLIHQGISKAMLLQSLAQTPARYQARLSEYQSLLNERESLQQSVRIGVRWDNNTAGVGEAVLESLLRHGVHSEPANTGEHYDGFIEIASQRVDSEIFNEFHVQLNANADLLGADGAIVSSARYQAAASSLASYEAATVSVNRVIARQVREQGVWRALNMQAVPKGPADRR